MNEMPLDIQRGSVIGNWKINELLGRGGQGSVWSAKPVRTKRAPQRALKACFAQDEQARARFVREVEILRRCDCPHILKVYDQELEWRERLDGLPAFAFYVAEKCHGSLEERARTLGDPRRRLELFRQACSAVLYLHSSAEPVIHRDIKPANFLIAQELNNLVLADFGIARPLAESTLTEAFEVVGTPYYRAPEVLHGNRGTIQSDVYCMGRLLEWLLTGDVSQDLGTRPVPRGGDLDDEACDVLDRLIAKATQVAPENRFASIRQMADHLPELWLSVRPRPITPSVVTTTDADQVLTAALEFARKNDQLGWRQLEQQVRRELVDGLTQWRTDNERKRSDGGKEASFHLADTLLDVGLPRIVLSLAAVYSSNTVIADQRRAVEDFLVVPGWNRGGRTSIVEGPRALLYVLHYLHGALCLSYGQHDVAIDFVQTAVSLERRDEIYPLWRHRDITGWPTLLGGNCVWAWEYLRSLHGRRASLRKLFALETDFDVSLASYSMLVSLMELATDAASPSFAALTDARDVTLEFPPLFVGLSLDTIGIGARRTIANRGLVEQLARRAGTSVSAMQKLWPKWKEYGNKFRRKAFDRWGYPDELPFGDLGSQG